MAGNNAMLTEATKAVRQPGVAGGYGEPALALPDVLVKTAATLAVVVIAAIPGWLFLSGAFWLYLGLLVVLMIVGVLLAKKAPISAGLALGYSVLLGLMVGAFSQAAVAYGGNIALIPQAVVGTIAGTIGMLAVYATPFGKKAARATKFFLGLMLGYFILGIVSFVFAILGGGDGWGFYGLGTFGIILSLLGVALASWSLLINIGQTDQALKTGVPQSYDWTFGVSLTSSLVWLYMEILRLLAIVNGN
jgi:uncharacterized YccA/Bax inhibitor family protein